jgi:hypothetical protein
MGMKVRKLHLDDRLRGSIARIPFSESTEKTKKKSVVGKKKELENEMQIG